MSKTYVLLTSWLSELSRMGTQQPPPGPADADNTVLLRRIEGLENRVRDLQQRLDAVSPSSSVPLVTTAPSSNPETTPAWRRFRLQILPVPIWQGSVDFTLGASGKWNISPMICTATVLIWTSET